MDERRYEIYRVAGFCTCQTCEVHVKHVKYEYTTTSNKERYMLFISDMHQTYLWI